MEEQAPAVEQPPTDKNAQTNEQASAEVSTPPVPDRKLTLAVWAQIEADCTRPDNPLNFTEAEAKYGVSRNTISKRADRKHWAIPRIIARQVEKKLEQTIEKVATKWKDRGERHRDVAFNLAHESLKKMKPRPPRNFREAEAADKIARRAAGLEVSEITQQTLIQINDAIDAHVLPCDERGEAVAEAVEAEVVEDTPAALREADDESQRDAPQNAEVEQEV